MASLQGYQFANVGEMMRDYLGWAPADFARFQTMMSNVFFSMNSGLLTTPSLLTCSDVDLLWHVAEAFVDTNRSQLGQDAYGYLDFLPAMLHAKTASLPVTSVAAD